MKWIRDGIFVMILMASCVCVVDRGAAVMNLTENSEEVHELEPLQT